MYGLTLKYKILIAAAGLPMVLPAVSACQAPGNAEIIEGILQRVDEMEGEMTIVTRDGETVTIKITKESALSGEDAKVGSEVKVETDKDNILQKEPELSITTDSLPEDILPSLENEADIFGVLGLREKAVELHERGLTWSHIAAEFNLSWDSMYAHLKEEAVARLDHASAEGLIDGETYEKLLVSFLDRAEKWIKEIFDHSDFSAVAVSGTDAILPPLNSFEDVFRALNVWEKAADLRERGLTWSHVARELDFGPDNMHIHLRETADALLEKAFKAGLITREQWERMFNEFDELALKWIREIFSDEESPDSDNGSPDDVSPVPVDILPNLDSIKSVFLMLEIWEKAADLRESGLTWAQVAHELGYTDDSMVIRLKETAGLLLEDAVHDGRITKDQYESMLQEFSEVAGKWVREIFSDDTVNKDAASLSNTDSDTDVAPVD